jgi:hypothetical protein
MQMRGYSNFEITSMIRFFFAIYVIKYKRFGNEKQNNRSYHSRNDVHEIKFCFTKT